MKDEYVCREEELSEGDLLQESHISWLTTDFWKSGTPRSPPANKHCSSWMKWDGILKAFHVGPA